GPRGAAFTLYLLCQLDQTCFYLCELPIPPKSEHWPCYAMQMALPSRAPLPEELLQYLPPYRVVVCTACRYAIQPKAIARHLKETHRIKSAERQSFLHYVGRYELAEHELVMQYTPGQFPVPLLPVQNGLQCRWEDCAYLCATEKRMKHHWVSIHRRQGVAECDWQAVPIQTFFKGNLLRYFTATPSDKSGERIAAQDTYQNGSEELTVSNQNKLIEYPSLTRILAHQYKFLMHALLACSALHMATFYPDQHSELTIKARSHQDHAMPLFRAAIPSVEDETCDAVLIFARLIAVTAFALDERLYTVGEKENKLPNWLFFIRSGCHMLCEVWARIGTGPVQALAISWEVLVDKTRFPHQPMLDYHLAIPLPDWPKEVRGPYNHSALALARTFSCIDALDDKIAPLDVVSFWPIQNSAEFVNMLSNWHPGALILLAHYCIVLHQVGMRIWYLQGQATSVMSTIMQRLDPKWHRYIEWPLRELGWPSSTKRGADELCIGSLILSGNISSAL
ncbi:Orsellinic acid/F9775 biosynthesis cluster protein D, partial [Lachnellula willkommii]